MNPREKFVRFEDWKSEKSSNGGSPHRFKIALGLVSNMFRKSFEHGSGGIKSLKRSIEFRSLNRLLSRGLGSGRKTLNPQGKFLQKWNKIFVLSCVIAVSVDPLFFYIPIVKDEKSALIWTRSSKNHHFSYIGAESTKS